jgi:hypothetical protein
MQQQHTGMTGQKKNQESQTISQRAIGRRKSFLMHVVAKLNF